MNFFIDPTDEAYKGSTWMYMRVAIEHTLTLLKDGSLILFTPWMWCRGRKREEHVLDSKNVFKEGKISTNGSLVRMCSYKNFPSITFLWTLSFSFLVFLQWPSFIGKLQVFSKPAFHLKERKISLMEVSLHPWVIKEGKISTKVA